MLEVYTYEIAAATRTMMMMIIR